ncbi:MAG: PrsW family intramembrane metalloprotease [Bacteroidaceae bacterium]|nr:PrsW family intramembrane metalloprotease [Bacteroidaceae bacterium]
MISTLIPRQMLLNYLFSLVPILLYVVLLTILDSFSLVRRRAIAVAIIYGALICGVCYAVSLYAGDRLWLYPPMEETLKATAVLYLTANRKIRFFAEALIIGAATGGGFSLMENIIYLIVLGDVFTPMEALFRGIATSLMHMGLAGLSGVLLLYISSKHTKKIYGIWGGMPLWLLFVVTLTPSVALHGMFNRYLVMGAADTMLVVTFISIMILFMLMFKLNERAIYRFLDTSVSSNVQLLSAMQRGEFSETPCGMYLMSVKEQFRSDVFLDMLCYLRLSLELSIIKSRDIMLAEAGLSMPRDPEREADEKAMSKEFSTLEKRIGQTGRLIIRPLIHQ